MRNVDFNNFESIVKVLLWSVFIVKKFEFCIRFWFVRFVLKEFEF